MVVVHELFGKRLIAENVLGARLAVVEVAFDGPDHNIRTGLSCHLLVLDVAYSAIGVHYGNLDAVLIAEPFQCCLAGVAGGCHQDKECVVQLALLAKLGCACAEEMRQALKGHVLEGACRAMPELKHVGVRIERGNRANSLIVEPVAIRCFHELIDFGIGQIDAKRTINEGCALGVGELRQGKNAVQAKLGKRFRDEKTAAFGEPFNDGFGKGDRSRTPSARVNIAIGSHESVFREG